MKQMKSYLSPSNWGRAGVAAVSSSGWERLAMSRPGGEINCPSQFSVEAELKPGLLTY
jgi:hypothetical protein